MDHYIEISILPNAEIEETSIMSALMQRLHLELVSSRQTSVGVSFPELGRTPGSVLRLHGPLEALASLVKSDWLKRFIDHVQVSGLLSVPGNCHYVSVSRVQPKLSRARIRRGVKRGIFTEAEAYQLLEGRAQMDRPFLMLRSGSSGQSYPFYLEQSLPTPQRVMGDFNAFGLSRTATVPWF